MTGLNTSIIFELVLVGFQVLIPALQPQIIIIGGSVGVYFDHFAHLLTEVLSRRIPHFIAMPRIVQAKHPEEAVVYGCYYYATHQGITIEA